MDNSQVIEQLRTDLKNTYNSNNFYGRNIASSFYKEYEEITYSKYENRKQTVGLKVYKNKNSLLSLLISLPLLIAGTAFHYGKTIESVIICLVCLIALGILCYIVFFKKKKIFLETYDDYFKIDGETIIYYEEVLITGVLTINSNHGGSIRHLILGMSDGEILKIKTENTDITAKDFIKIIHLNR